VFFVNEANCADFNADFSFHEITNSVNTASQPMSRMQIQAQAIAETAAIQAQIISRTATAQAQALAQTATAQSMAMIKTFEAMAQATEAMANTFANMAQSVGTMYTSASIFGTQTNENEPLVEVNISIPENNTDTSFHSATPEPLYTKNPISEKLPDISKTEEKLSDIPQTDENLSIEISKLKELLQSLLEGKEMINEDESVEEKLKDKQELYPLALEFVKSRYVAPPAAPVVQEEIKKEIKKITKPVYKTKPQEDFSEIDKAYGNKKMRTRIQTTPMKEYSNIEAIRNARTKKNEDSE